MKHTLSALALFVLLCGMCAGQTQFYTARVRPRGVFGTNVCVFDVLTRTPYINVPISLNLYFKHPGIHLHDLDNFPLGRVEPQSSMTTASGCFDWTYYSADIAEEVQLTATTPFLPGQLVVVDIQVYEPDMVILGPSQSIGPNDGLPDYLLPMSIDVRHDRWQQGYVNGVHPGTRDRIEMIALERHQLFGQGPLPISRLGDEFGGMLDDGLFPWTADYGDDHMAGRAFDVDISENEAATLGYIASGHGCSVNQKPSGPYHVQCVLESVTPIIF